jgi:tetratricopeptide (TPR) repeat protein
MRKRFLLLILLLVLPVSAQEPVDAGGWFRHGIARHDAGDYAGALAAYRRAEAMNFGQIVPLYLREARAYAKLGSADKTFEVLGKLAAAGFSNAELLDAENDLLPIRLDPRYAQTIAALKKNAHPCAAPEFRQFDYWLGEWDVQANGQRVATSSIQLILDECVIFENYYAQRGYSGKSFSIYDRETKKWQQRYVDTTGAFHTWEGGLEDGVLRFFWHHGDKLERMTYLRQGPDQVRQLIESSADDGKSWATTYDGLYVRRK